MYLLGIDLGTSALKLLLLDSDGEILEIVSETYSLSMPYPGWAEQDPEDWWKAVRNGFATLAQSYDLSKIAALSFSGQMHGLVALDNKGKVIRPAILWNDNRSHQEVTYLNDEIGRKKLIQETGNIAYAGFTLPKLLWLRKHETYNFKCIHKILLPKDYLAYRFTGHYSTDYSDASGTLLLDVKDKKWSKFVLELCGLEESVLPQLYEGYEVVGKVKPNLAEKLGLSPDCVVAAGAGDNAAAAIGSGVLEDLDCNISLGTSGTIFIKNSHFISVPNSEVHSFAHADGSYHLLGCILSAASANKWWVEDILCSNDYDSVLQNDVKLGENSVYFMPYLMGERSPLNDEKVRGAFIGLALNTSRQEMSLAILEGVAYALKSSLDIATSLGLDVIKSKISGGGAKSEIWKIILANVLQLEIEENEVSEAPALGAAILAGLAAGRFSSFEEACHLLIKTKDCTKPSPALMEKYAQGYKRFSKLYPMLKGFY